jgi:hypothetical protein
MSLGTRVASAVDVPIFELTLFVALATAAAGAAAVSLLLALTHRTAHRGHRH